MNKTFLCLTYVAIFKIGRLIKAEKNKTDPSTSNPLLSKTYWHNKTIENVMSKISLKEEDKITDGNKLKLLTNHVSQPVTNLFLNV